MRHSVTPVGPGPILVLGIAALAIAPGPIRAGAPEADPALAARVLARMKTDHATLLLRRYVESSVLERLDGDGEVRTRRVEVNEVFTRDGRRVLRPLAADGIDAEQGFATMRDEEARALRPAGGAGREETSGRERFDTAALFDCFVLQPLGPDAIDGRPALRVAFSAREGCRPGDSRAARLLANLAGTLWIDPEGDDLLRVRGSLRSPVTFGFGLLGRVDTFDLEIDRERVDAAFHAVTRIAYRARGHAFLIRRFDLRSVRQRSAFSSASSEVAATPAPAAGERPDVRVGLDAARGEQAPPR